MEVEDLELCLDTFYIAHTRKNEGYSTVWYDAENLDDR